MRFSKRYWSAPAGFAQIDPQKFSLQHWTERPYYEVCTNPAIYAMLKGKTAKGGF